jgi:hypothetical protein
MSSPLNFMSVQRLLRHAVRAAADVAGCNGGEDYVDVRLVLTSAGPRGRVFMNVGDVSYDTEHFPLCAASQVSSDTGGAEIRHIANDLIGQIRFLMEA